MKKTLDQLERDVERKIACRVKKRKPRMRVSGRAVFTLRSIIQKKARQSRKRTTAD